MLQFGMKPPFSHRAFLEKCKGQLVICDMEMIENEIEERSLILKEWDRFDTSLRNELVKNRAVRKQKEPQQYIKGDSSSDPFIALFSRSALNQDSPLDAELYLDRVRWEKLEELAIGHCFDIDFLVTYSLKLKILERWNKIDSGTGMDVLEGMLKTGER